MGHPLTLLKRIADDVRRVYPEPDFRYEFEKPLSLKDRANQPDIQVFDFKNQLVCVVEIGYSRPEKVQLYYEQQIQDVRWYSKAGKRIPLVLGPTPVDVPRIPLALYDISIAARVFSKTTFEVKQLCRAGALKYVRIGHRWLISPQAIQRFIETTEQVGGAA